MKIKISKTQAQEKIKEFFSNIKNKCPKEIKKIKKIAMGQSIKLKEERKKFCKYCLRPYSGIEKIRIKNKIKSLTCGKCRKVVRWKIK